MPNSKNAHLMFCNRRAAIAAAVAASLLSAQAGLAATYIYTGAGPVTDTWSTGNNWSLNGVTPSVPASGPTTTLVFGNGVNSAGTITTTNDVANPFQLNQMLISYNGTAAGTLNITGSPLSFVSDGATTPVLRIANTGTLPTVNINTPLVFTNNTAVIATTAAVFGGQTSGSGNITKSGAGTLTVNAVTAAGGTGNGDLIINEGTVTLNFTTLSTSFSNILGSGTSLSVGNDPASGLPVTLQVSGRNSAVTNTQTFADTTIRPGRTAINVTRGANASNVLTLNLSAITRQPGGVVNFAPTTTGNAFITTTTANDASGILGGWATITTSTGSAFATNSGVANANDGGTGGTNIVAYTGYTISGGTIANGPTTNVQVDSSSAGDVTMAASGVTTINTLSISDAAARNIVIGDGNRLRLGASGAVWRNVPVANETLFSISGGELTAGGADNTPGELFLRNDAAANTAATPRVPLYSTISSKIVDNGTADVRVVKSGAQGITLTAANTYEGGTHILQGALGATQSDGFGSGDVYVFTEGQAWAEGAEYNNDFFIAGSGPSISFSTVSSRDGAIRLGATTTINGAITLIGDANISNANMASVATLAGPITGNFNVSFNTGGGKGSSLKISNSNNAWTGNTTVAAQATSGSTGSLLQLGADEVIPNGPGFGNVIIGSANSSNPSARLSLAGNDETINGLVSSGLNQYYANRQLQNGSASPGLLILGDNNATATFTGVISNGTGTLTLRKIGNGTQTFGGTASHTGTTTVIAGVLSVDFNQVGTSLSSSPANYYSTVSDLHLNGGRFAIAGRLNGAATSQSATYNNTSTITLPSVAGLVVGQNVTSSGTSIPANAYIVAINTAAKTITLNVASTGGAVTETVSTSATTASTSQTIKSLTLDGASGVNSTLDFGGTDSVVLTFNGAPVQLVDGSTLSVANWNGVLDTGGGAERLMFVGEPTDFTSVFSQSEIQFIGYASGYQIVDGANVYEVLPGMVPEPTSIATLALAAGMLLRRRRRVQA